MPITGDLTAWVAQMLLLLVRVSAFFIISPIWGRANIPPPLKIGLSVLVTMILINFFPPPVEPLYHTLIGYLMLVVGELLVGLMFGYITTLFFSVVFTAGHLIDTQIGFGMVQVYDATANIQVPIAGSLLNLILLLCFLISGGHLRLIEILADTFSRVPIGRVDLKPELGLVVLNAFTRSFLIAMQVAIPIIASGLLAEIGLGIIVRTAPQMNVFVIGIPIKTIIGLVILSLIMPVFVSMTSPLFSAMFEELDHVIQVLAPA